MDAATKWGSPGPLVGRPKHMFRPKCPLHVPAKLMSESQEKAQKSPALAPKMHQVCPQTPRRIRYWQMNGLWKGQILPDTTRYLHTLSYFIIFHHILSYFRRITLSNLSVALRSGGIIFNQGDLHLHPPPSFPKGRRSVKCPCRKKYTTMVAGTSRSWWYIYICVCVWYIYIYSMYMCDYLCKCIRTY